MNSEGDNYKIGFTDYEELPDNIQSLAVAPYNELSEVIKRLWPYHKQYFWIDMILGTAFDKLNNPYRTHYCYHDALATAYRKRYLIPTKFLIKLTNYIYSSCDEDSEVKDVSWFFGNNHVAISMINSLYIYAVAKHRKMRVLSLAYAAERILVNQDNDYFTSISYNTIAMAAAWHGDEQLAIRVQGNFLKDSIYSRQNFLTIKDYLVMLGAGKMEKVLNIIRHNYPEIFRLYKPVFDAIELVDSPDSYEMSDRVKDLCNQIIVARNNYEL